MQPHPLLSKVPGIRWAGRIFFILLAAIFLAMGGLLAAAFVIESRETAVLRSEGIRVAADIEGGVTMWQKKRRDGSEVSHKFEFTVAYTDKSGASHRKSITTSKDALKVSHGDGKSTSILLILSILFTIQETPVFFVWLKRICTQTAWC